MICKQRWFCALLPSVGTEWWFCTEYQRVNSYQHGFRVGNELVCWYGVGKPQGKWKIRVKKCEKHDTCRQNVKNEEMLNANAR